MTQTETTDLDGRNMTDDLSDAEACSEAARNLAVSASGSICGDKPYDAPTVGVLAMAARDFAEASERLRGEPPTQAECEAAKRRAEDAQIRIEELEDALAPLIGMTDPDSILGYATRLAGRRDLGINQEDEF